MQIQFHVYDRVDYLQTIVHIRTKQINCNELKIVKPRFYSIIPHFNCNNINYHVQPFFVPSDDRLYRYICG